jgi:hypothetical protein
MVEDKDSKDKQAGKQPPQKAGDQPRIQWDGSNMRSLHPDVFNVAGTKEEVSLIFGTKQVWDAGQQELKVHLTDRILMSPYAAKRLSLLLGKVIQDYEERYGILDIKGTRPETATIQ